MVIWKPLAVKIVVAEIAKNVFTVIKWLQKHFVLFRNIKTNALLSIRKFLMQCLSGRCGKSVEKSEGKWNLQNKLLYYFTLLSPMVEPYRRKIFFLIYHTAFICKAPLSNIVRMI